jgi:hypothetical protein
MKRSLRLCYNVYTNTGCNSQTLERTRQMSMNGMEIKAFLETASILPADTSVLIRGNHGIGKSQIVRTLSKFFSLEVIDRRLSQMCEGDMIGLPSLDEGTTKFNPPDWYMLACKTPKVLFLDEINRATPEIMQAAFQIILDRELNGFKLHPKSRVYAAINTGNKYSVNDMDPALLDRFWVVDLEPSVEDWLIWANTDNNIHQNISMFIQDQPKFLDPVENVNPGTVQSSRRSWKRLNDALVHTKMISQPQNPVFLNMSIGYIGFEAAAAFYNFVKNISGNLTAEELMDAFSTDTVQLKIKNIGQEAMNTCIDKIVTHAKTLVNLNDNQKKNMAAFMKILPNELRVSFWTKMVAIEKIDIIKSFHDAVGNLVVEIFAESK